MISIPLTQTLFPLDVNKIMHFCGGNKPYDTITSSLRSEVSTARKHIYVAGDPWSFPIHGSGGIFPSWMDSWTLSPVVMGEWGEAPAYIKK